VGLSEKAAHGKRQSISLGDSTVVNDIGQTGLELKSLF